MMFTALAAGLAGKGVWNLLRNVQQRSQLVQTMERAPVWTRTSPYLLQHVLAPGEYVQHVQVTQVVIKHSPMVHVGGANHPLRFTVLGDSWTAEEPLLSWTQWHLNPGNNKWLHASKPTAVQCAWASPYLYDRLYLSHAQAVETVREVDLRTVPCSTAQVCVATGQKVESPRTICVLGSNSPDGTRFEAQVVSDDPWVAADQLPQLTVAGYGLGAGAAALVAFLRDEWDAHDGDVSWR